MEVVSMEFAALRFDERYEMLSVGSILGKTNHLTWARM